MAALPDSPDQRPGLSSEQARQQLQRTGPNILPTGHRSSPLRLLVGQMVHFFALMLWVAAALAAIAGMPQLAVAIVAVVIVNGLFAFVQEYRSDQAAARLQDLLPARATVIRDGTAVVVDARELVPGDVVLINAGDRISADLQIEASDALAIDQSTLTGESATVHPRQEARLFAGTHCVEGQARAVVIATADKTRLGAMATLASAAKPPPSPLHIQLQRVVRTLAIVAVAIGCAALGAALLRGMPAQDGFLFAVGVSVALVPEGLLPTVTLSLARTAQRMARENALVRHLEAIETLGATTFICTDKTGTLTRNEMAAVVAWTPVGDVRVAGQGYAPTGDLTGAPDAVAAAGQLARVAASCTTGRPVNDAGTWKPEGDPMEVALGVLALRSGLQDLAALRTSIVRRHSFDPRRRRSSVLTSGEVLVMGAPDSVLPLCPPSRGAIDATHALSQQGLRVLAFARRPASAGDGAQTVELVERNLEIVGLVGLEDPPRDTSGAAVASCRRAGIRLAMITGDHPGTAAAIGREVGLLLSSSPVLTGTQLPQDEAELGELIDADGVVVARATPEDKLRITRALQARGHVVAMTGDGVNDGPALRAADIGVAMGASGTDVAREASDLVLLDDRFETIVAAIELGRAGFANIRRFLTYHLTDNVAELTPFLVWSLSAGNVPLAIGVLQILALDIGTDLLPALALGGEPPTPHTMQGAAPRPRLIDRRLLGRVFGVLGPAEAIASMAAFAGVLLIGGWRWGDQPSATLLSTASGTAFAAIVLGQLANAYACRSETHSFLAVLRRPNSLLPAAIASELVVLLIFLSVPQISSALGGSFPSAIGWLFAFAAAPAVLLADALQKAVSSRRAQTRRVQGRIRSLPSR